ncbi:TPM domain-containing protein [Pseudoflavitalea sp. X16]|uniref:TPM domain-containing protein n=1 Tax=Paraflavitalea devenefica TaxID=2716334 RepID=UPI001422194B|nr:TPM domain-containing protein [Paraflavitalea devenefica]NII25347.1 TPM domain-containing protein [Paraflavitalea devenefica]
MRPLFFLTVSLLITCFSYAQQKQQPDKRFLPKPVGAVNDFGAMLTLQERQALEKELTQYWKATTNAIVILTLDSLPVDPATKTKQTIEQTALLYFNTWGIGDSIKNNGVLILLSKYDRQVRIEVGKGLETTLTNQICADIIAQQIVPHFKKQAFFTGLSEAIQALKKELSQGKQSAALKPSAKFDTRKLPATDKQGILAFIIPVAIIIIIWSIVKKNRNNNRAGAGMINPGYQDQEHLLNNINDQHIINNSIMASGAMGMMDTSPDPGVASPPDTPAANDAGSGSFDSGGSSFDGGASSGGGASSDW